MGPYIWIVGPKKLGVLLQGKKDIRANMATLARVLTNQSWGETQLAAMHGTSNKRKLEIV